MTYVPKSIHLCALAGCQRARTSSSIWCPRHETQDPNYRKPYESVQYILHDENGIVCYNRNRRAPGQKFWLTWSTPEGANRFAMNHSSECTIIEVCVDELGRVTV